MVVLEQTTDSLKGKGASPFSGSNSIVSANQRDEIHDPCSLGTLVDRPWMEFKLDQLIKKPSKHWLMSNTIKTERLCQRNDSRFEQVSFSRSLWIRASTVLYKLFMRRPRHAETRKILCQIHFPATSVSQRPGFSEQCSSIPSSPKTLLTLAAKSETFAPLSTKRATVEVGYRRPPLSLAPLCRSFENANSSTVCPSRVVPFGSAPCAKRCSTMAKFPRSTATCKGRTSHHLV